MQIQGKIDVENIGNETFNIFTSIILKGKSKVSILYETVNKSSYQEFNILYNRAVNKLNEVLKNFEHSFNLLSQYQKIKNNNEIISRSLPIEDDNYKHITDRKYEKIIDIGEY